MRDLKNGLNSGKTRIKQQIEGYLFFNLQTSII